MKGKYITTDILLACLSHGKAKASIHEQLAATIAEHSMIKQHFLKKIDAIIKPGSKKDIHQELAATVASLKSGFYSNPFLNSKLDEAA